MTPISRLMQAAPVIPVLIIDDLQHAVQIASRSWKSPCGRPWRWKPSAQ